MADEKDGHALGVEPQQRIEHRAGFLFAEPGGGLVGDHQTRGAMKRAREHHQPLLAGIEHESIFVDPDIEAEFVEYPPRHPSPVGFRQPKAARFIAEYDLGPEPELVASVAELHGRLSIVSAERIRDELDRLVTVPTPGPGLWFSVRTGLASEFLPELPALELEQDPIHRHKDVLAHTLAVVDKTSPNRLLRLAALFHDVGKPRTRAITDGGVSFHHHEVVGARMIMNDAS